MTELDQTKEKFAESMAQISQFWGFPRAMGAVYAAVYLSPGPISLDEIVAAAGVSKGAVSTNVRSLSRLGMIQRQIAVGDRKDYYVAEEDFWSIARGILREREKSEFDRALRGVSQCLDRVEDSSAVAEDPQEALFLSKRIGEMTRFFERLDGIVGILLALDDLRPTAFLRSLRSQTQRADDA